VRAADPNSRAGGASALAGEWFMAYTDYLKRASSQSTDTIELYQQLIDRIVKGELSAEESQNLLGAFVRNRGTAYTERLSQVLMRFFTEIVRISSSYGQELGQAVLPGASVPPVPPLSFNMADPTAWFQQLNDYSSRLSASIAASYQTVADRAAAGEVQPGELQEAAGLYVQRRLPQYLGELSQLYFELLNGLTDLRVHAEQEFLQVALARDDGDRFELTLSAPVGSSASASISIANTRDQLARIRYRISDVRRADGVGPAFAPDVVFAPESMELAPGDEARLTIGLLLAGGQYQPDVPYVGILEITGHGDPRLEVPLRIEATQQAAAPAR
jgi:hypothetical protein